MLTKAFCDLPWFTIRVFAIDPLFTVEISLVLLRRSVVVNRLVSSTSHVSWYPGSSVLSGSPVHSTMEILSPRSKGRRTAIIIIPSINFAADGPTAKANDTRTVESETSSAHGFRWRTLIIVNARTKPKTLLKMLSRTPSIRDEFPTEAQRYLIFLYTPSHDCTKCNRDTSSNLSGRNNRTKLFAFLSSKVPSTLYANTPMRSNCKTEEPGDNESRRLYSFFELLMQESLLEASPKE
mmetsp:Transcript_57437/g.121886  ORF Transcript_57437/g.121886 Transcript_57437/m.121886 type:complete len:237 (+) Transcript_57437:565-1275(+)